MQQFFPIRQRNFAAYNHLGNFSMTKPLPSHFTAHVLGSVSEYMFMKNEEVTMKGETVTACHIQYLRSLLIH